jgi:hypothetical protein
VADIVAFDIYTVNYQGYQPWIPMFLPQARQVVNQRTPEAKVWLVNQGFGADKLATPSGDQFHRQVMEGIEYGSIDGLVAFLWDRTWDGRFLDFYGDLRSSDSLRAAFRHCAGIMQSRVRY